MRPSAGDAEASAPHAGDEADSIPRRVVALADAYRTGRLRPSTVTERVLERADEAIFRFLTPERARAQAARADAWFERGVIRSALQGVPIGLKDLLDTRGTPTTVGSAALAGSAAAREDADVAAALEAAGAVFVGKTTMTELAFSGLGLNQHAPIPANALDPRRVPGGSSSGSAVGVARGLLPAAIGSDTGGSVRIPATFNGLVGLKPSAGALSMHGVAKISSTFDTLGPIVHDTADAWAVWTTVRGSGSAAFTPRPVKGLRLAVPTTLVHDDLDDEVARGFERACEELSRRGAILERRAAPILEEIHATYLGVVTIGIVEAYAAFESLLGERAHDIDPRVVRRLDAGAAATGADLARLHVQRDELTRRFWKTFEHHEAVLAPTVPVLPPLRAPLEDGDEALFARTNALVVRNTRLANYVGCPASTVPAPAGDGPPFVGFMTMTRPGQEHLALSVGHAVEGSPLPD